MARLTVNDQETTLIKTARELAKLQAKRRGILEQLVVCDVKIAKASDALRAITPSAAATDH